MQRIFNLFLSASLLLTLTIFQPVQAASSEEPNTFLLPLAAPLIEVTAGQFVNEPEEELPDPISGQFLQTPESALPSADSAGFLETPDTALPSARETGFLQEPATAMPVIPEEGGFLKEISAPDPDAIVITTAEELASIQSGSYVLGCDIDLSEYNNGVWNPINLSGELILDGQGHKILNLNIPEDSAPTYAGLFTPYYDCHLTVRNLGIESTVDGVSIHGTESAGAIVGCALCNVTIENCYNTIPVSAVDEDYMTTTYAGGLIGLTSGSYWGEISTCTITHSYNTATITVTPNWNAYDMSEEASCAGGLVGSMSSSNDQAIVTIQNCINTGTVSGASRCGGLMGYFRNSNGTINLTAENCSNSGSISGSAIGGLLGAAYTEDSNPIQITLTNCENSGTLSATQEESDIWCAGGLVGYTYVDYYTWQGVTNPSTITATNCYNTGAITTYALGGGLLGQVDGHITLTDCYNSAPISGYNTLGGLIAEATGSHTMEYSKGVAIHRCFNTGDITGLAQVWEDWEDGTLYYSYYLSCAGGLIAKGSMVLGGTISSSFNTGDITGTVSDPSSDPFTAGGLAGTLYTDITDSYNSGDVHIQVDSSCQLDSSAALGGLTGWGIGALSNCYNTGDVQFISSSYGESGSVNVGGLVGNARKSAYDKEDRVFSAASCYNTGDILASTNAGGIVAYTGEASAFSRCYNTGSITATNEYAAGLGYCLNSIVSAQNSFNTGAITGNTNAAGLIVQYHSTNTTNFPVSHLTQNCYNTGTVQATGEESVAAGLSLVRDYYDPTDYGTISNCYNTGAVSAVDAYGLGSGVFSHCYNTGSITATNIGSGIGYGPKSHCANLGIIRGAEAYGLGKTHYNTGFITNSWNSGGVIGSDLAYGLGYTHYFEDCYNTGSIVSQKNAAALGVGSAENCFNTGSVTGQTYTSGLVYDVYYTGGYLRSCYNAGALSSTASDGYVAGLISTTYRNSGSNPYSITDCANLADISTKGRVAGIATTSLHPTLTISRCYNLGDITSTNGYTAVGLTFYCYSMSDCCNLGNITSTSNTIGMTVAGLTMNAPYSMHNCYNTGKISASGYSDGTGITAGGLAGYEMYYDFYASYCYNSGNVSAYNSFLDTTTYAKPNNGNTCDEIADMTADELANSSPCYHPGKTYAGGLLGQGDITINKCRSLGSQSASNDPRATCPLGWYRHTGPYTADGSVDYGTNSVSSRLVLSIQNKTDAGKDHRVVLPDDSISLSVYLTHPDDFDPDDVTFSLSGDVVELTNQSYSASTDNSGYFTLTLKAQANLEESTVVTLTASASIGSQKASDICRILVDTENSFTFYVTHFGELGDEDNFTPLEGASITVNGVTKTTGEDGYVSFTKEETNCQQEVNVCSFSATKEGYFTLKYDYKGIYTDRVNNVTLGKKEENKIYITSATVTTCNTAEDVIVRSRPLTLLIEAQETCYTSISIDWNEMEEGIVKLVGTESGNSYTLTSTGSGSVPYWKIFEEGEAIKVYAKTVAKDGSPVEESRPLQVETIHLAPEVKIAGSEETVTTKDDDPMIGGFSVGIKWDKILSKSDYKNTNNVKVGYSDGVCSVTFEVTTRDPSEGSYSTPLELFKFGDSSPRLEVSASGTLNIPILDGKDGSGTINASIMLLPSKETEEKYKMNSEDVSGVAWEWDLPIWQATPLYGKFGLGGKVTVGATVNVPSQEYLFQTIEGFLKAENYVADLGLEGVLEVEGGIGKEAKKVDLAAKAGLKFTGNPYVGFNYVYGKDVTFTPKLTGMGSIVFNVDIFALEVDAQVDVGGFEWTKDGFYWLDHNKQRIVEDAAAVSTTSLAAISSDDRMGVVSGSYLANGGGFSAMDISFFGIETSSAKVIYENIFTNSSAALTAADEEKVLYFTTDVSEDGDRTRSNALMLVETKPEASFREMTPIEDDGTLDSAFAADGTVVIWEDANQIFGDDLTLSQLLAAKDITAAVKIDGEWAITRLTNNEVLDHAPAVAQAEDGTALAAWLSNSANDYTAESGTNNLHYAYFDGTAWSDVHTISDIGYTVSVDVLYDGTTAMLVYKSGLTEHNVSISLDDLSAQNDATELEMYRYVSAMVNGEKKLAYFDENDVLHLPDGTTVATEYDGFSNPVIGVEANEICVFWTEFDGIYYTTNREGSFSTKLHLYESNGMIWNLDARQNSSGSYYLSWLETNTFDDGDATFRRTDLMVMEAEPGVDLSVEYVEYQEEAFAQLGMVSGNAYIRNNGNTTATSVELTAWTEGNCMLSEILDLTIAPGETVEVPYSFVARDPGTKAEYIICAEDTVEDELAEEDNEHTISVGTADAAMTAVNVITQDDGTSYMRLRAINHGSTTLKNVSIVVYDETMSNPVTVLTGKTMYAGQSVDWAADLIDLEFNALYYATIVAEGDENTSNNSCMFLSPRDPSIPSHTLSKTEAVAATCTEPGTNAYWTCSACNDVFANKDGTTPTTVEAQVIPALGHSYSEWVILSPATCTTKGEQSHTCQRTGCEHFETEAIEIDPNAHNYGAPAYEWHLDAEEPYCAETRVCSYNNSHIHTTTYQATVITTPATCTQAGSTVYTVTGTLTGTLEHTVVLEALGHSEVTDTAVSPTCTETGLSEGKHCTVCKTVTVAQSVVPAKGHSEVVDSAVAATCTETGLSEGKHCTVCNTVTVAQSVVPAKGHSEVVDSAVAATCTETGLSEGKHCTVCKTVTVAQSVVPAKGHSEVVDSAVAATCTETGLSEGKHCTVCNTVTVAQSVVPAKGHSEVVDSAVAATCTETGLSEGKHCTVCNEVLIVQTVVAAYGHTYTDDSTKFQWNADYSGAVANYDCTKCNHSGTAECTVTCEVVNGALVFTAGCQNNKDGMNLTSTQTIRIVTNGTKRVLCLSLYGEETAAHMKMMVAAYSTDGRLAGVQFVDPVSAETDITVHGDVIKVFFLNRETNAPIWLVLE